MRWIVLCVDGTTSSDYRRGDGSDNNSFVKRIHANFQTPSHRKCFLDGPSLIDALPEIGYLLPHEIVEFALSLFEVEIRETAKIINSAKVFFKKQYRINGNSLRDQSLFRIALFGYSRGGAIVMEIAKWLGHKYGIQVYFMGLFDAVSRSFSSSISQEDTPVINVRKTYHALRGRRFIFRHSNYVRSFDLNFLRIVEMIGYGIATEGALLSNVSRSMFGNTGLQSSDGRPVVKKEFHTNHGGMGIRKTQSEVLHSLPVIPIIDDLTIVPQNTAESILTCYRSEINYVQLRFFSYNRVQECVKKTYKNDSLEIREYINNHIIISRQVYEWMYDNAWKNGLPLVPYNQ